MSQPGGLTIAGVTCGDQSTAGEHLLESWGRQTQKASRVLHIPWGQRFKVINALLGGAYLNSNGSAVAAPPYPYPACPFLSATQIEQTDWWGPNSADANGVVQPNNGANFRVYYEPVIFDSVTGQEIGAPQITTSEQILTTQDGTLFWTNFPPAGTSGKNSYTGADAQVGAPTFRLDFSHITFPVLSMPQLPLTGIMSIKSCLNLYDFLGFPQGTVMLTGLAVRPRLQPFNAPGSIFNFGIQPSSGGSTGCVWQWDIFPTFTYRQCNGVPRDWNFFPRPPGIALGPSSAGSPGTPEVQPAGGDWEAIWFINADADTEGNLPLNPNATFSGNGAGGVLPADDNSNGNPYTVCFPYADFATIFNISGNANVQFDLDPGKPPGDSSPGQY